MVAGASTQFSDAANDVRMTTSDGALRNGAGSSAWRNLDILSGGVFDETDDLLVFFLNVTAITPEQDPAVPKSQPTYWFYFDYGLRTYRVEGKTDLTTPWDGIAGAAVGSAKLEVAYNDGVFQAVGDAAMAIDFSADQILFMVERSLIRNHNEAPLGRGDVLSGFWGSSRSLGGFGVSIPIGNNFQVEAGPPAYHDQAPDYGTTGGTYTTTAGHQLHKGQLVAASEDPVRWTNGEATTFVYFVRLFNSGSIELEVKLSHEGADPSWQVAFSDRLVVPARSSINVTFHVGIPFGHFHGKLDDFVVSFTTDDGVHWAKQPLAVYWPKIPQPAGHHPTVWLHSQYRPREAPFEGLGDSVHGWFSAASPDTEEYDEQAPIMADRIDGPQSDGRSTAQWTFHLEPALRMGLDFLLDQTGNGQIIMDFPVQVQDPVLQFDLVHLNKRTIIPKTTFAMTSLSALPGTQSGLVAFTFPDLKAEAAADLIKHAARADLEFRLNLTATLAGTGNENPEEFTPTIVPADSYFTLPLREYHDPLDTVFVTDASVKVTVGPEGQFKQVNPGKQAVFTFELYYHGTFRSGFDIELSGINSAWARVLGDAHFEMDPDTVREVAVAIQPPADARQGDYADITIKAIGSVNAAVQAGMVVRAEVVGSRQVADEAELAKQKEVVLTAPEDQSAVVWPWFVFAPLAVIGAAAGVLYRVRPELLLFWR